MLMRRPSWVLGEMSAGAAGVRVNGSPVVNTCWNTCGVPPVGRNSAIAMYGPACGSGTSSMNRPSDCCAG